MNDLTSKSSIQMNHKFLKSLLTLCSAMLLCTSYIQAQNDHPDLNIYFKKYEVIHLQTEDLLNTIHASSGGKIELKINRWNLMLYKSDLFSPSYTCINELGVQTFDVKDGWIVPMNGYTDKGERVSLTLGKNFIQGFVKGFENTFYIEPVRHFDKGSNVRDFVIYDEKDIISGKEYMCGVEESKHRVNKNQIIGNRNVQSGGCYEVEYAIATDWLMYNHYGSTSAVEAQNIAIVNDMQTNYDDEFNDEIRFALVQQYIVTSSGGDPWTSSTDAGNLLNSFTAWGPSGFSVNHDLGTLWTYRDLDGSTIGLAWIGAVCESYRYNILQDFTSDASLKRVLAAHEIGHNFNANHDSGSGYIMSPSVSSTTVWSQASLNAINAYYPGSSCLGACTPLTPEVDFLIPSVSILEAGGSADANYCGSPYKTISIPVKLNRVTQSSSTIGVSVKSGATATSGRDYVLKNSTLTFPAGSASTQYVNIDIVNDAIEESEELFTLKLNWISGPAQVGGNDECEVTILDGLDAVSNTCCSPGSYTQYGSGTNSITMIFFSSYQDARSRFLYLPSQLSSAGISAGFISGLSLYVQFKNSTQPFNNFRIGLKNVNISTLDGAPWYDTESVFTGTISTVANQWLRFDFSQPFYWDGTSALYFEYCYDNSSSSNDDYIRFTNPVGGGSDTYVEAYVDNSSQGCSLGSGSIPVNYGSFKSTQPQLQIYKLQGVQVENTVNKIAKTSISAGETAHLYSNNQKIIASIKNIGTTNIGCLEAKVATAGTGKKALPFGNGNYADKTIQITGDNNALYEVTLYYSSDQMTTWSGNAGKLNFLKSNVAVANATINDVEIVRPDTVFSALGQDNAYAYKATFSGFSWFTLTDYNIFNDLTIGIVDLQFDAISAGILMQNIAGDVYKLNVNNSGQLIASSASSSDYKTMATASGIYVKDTGKGVIFKTPNGSNYRLTISNAGQITLNSVSTLPSVQVKQQTGNISINKPAGSLILKSPDSNCWRIYIKDDGKIRAVKVSCP
jgi:hypothetical protein